MKQILWIVLAVTIYGQSSARSFGVEGEVFPVQEQSFLQLIEERLADLESQGAVESLNQQWLHTVAAHSNRPTPLRLSRTIERKVHIYSPEVVLGQALKDINGAVLFPAGTRVNALEQLPSYSPCWLFFNADDVAQINWAKKQSTQCQNPKMILTGGAVSDAEKQLNATIYFDQEGRITQRLRISSVPAQVMRLGNTLQIVEMAIKENGDEV